jgi:hypothetical protein
MSIYKITVLNSAGAPLVGATVVFGAQDGNGIVTLTTGADGTVSIDESVVGSLAGVPVYATASYPGLETYTWSGSQMTGDKTITLPNDTTATALVIGGVAVGALWLLSRDKKRKRVGAVDFKKVAADVKPFLLPAAVVIGGALVTSKVFGTGGLFGQSQTDANTNTVLTRDIAAGPAATMTDSQIADYANALNQDLGYSSISNNTTDAMRILMSVGNVTDILKLVQAYGRHWITFFGIPTGTYTLPETVVKQLSSDQVNTVNTYYADNGINYKF